MRLVRRHERVLLMGRRDREPESMLVHTPARAGRMPGGSEDDRAVHFSVVEAALRSPAFGQESWRLVVNRPDRSVYGVAPGVYPDIVALDGSDAGVAWILEVATPATIVDEGAWERWSAIAATGLSFILAVPYGAGSMTEKAADMLDTRPGLIYEYGMSSGGVFFSLPGSRRLEPFI